MDFLGKTYHARARCEPGTPPHSQIGRELSIENIWSGTSKLLSHTSLFLEWQPCHSSVMVFCSSNAIYLGFCLIPFIDWFLFLCGKWSSLVFNYSALKFLVSYSLFQNFRTLPFPAMISLLV